MNQLCTMNPLIRVHLRKEVRNLHLLLDSRVKCTSASPSKDRLPTSYSKGPFCHTCQTNQMLLMNLLSNYLPPTNVSIRIMPFNIFFNLLQSPEYERRLENLAEYRESLQLRYPPVCATCLPLVEDEIRRKNDMARSKALGGWLQETKGKEKQRKVSGAGKELEKVTVQLIAWRVRGCLWVGSLAAALVGNSIGESCVAEPLLMLTPFTQSPSDIRCLLA
jgi:hypothetical protein